MCEVVDCAKAFEPARKKKAAKKRTATARCVNVEIRQTLARFTGRSVRILAEQGSVTFGENFHQPAIEVIDRVVHDGFESTIVLSMSLLNVVFQPDADIFVFAAEPDLLWP